ncbi:acyl-CoA thioesterase [Propionibacteriaceae bacterium Y1923]|uniref:acyl-CoA thioesterase n=1 Tax=Aestuariimicrobium sp. Y1814 TaxID=3418742 RepID=UPI003C2A6B52
MTEPTSLLRLLTLDQVEATTFRGPQLHVGTPWEHQRTFGGQVMAQALMAAAHTLGPERRCHSMHAYFLRPGSNALPIDYRVELTRDGNTFSQRRVTAYQADVLLFTLNASYHLDEPGLEHADPIPAGVPDPDDCPGLGEVLRDRIGPQASQWITWRGLDVRFVGDSQGDIASGAHAAHLRVWARTIEDLPDDPRLHTALAAYLSDLTILSAAAVPHPVSILSPKVQAASLDHAMWFHRDLRADRWLLHDQISPTASNGLGFSNGRLFQGGRLSASVSQEGLIRLAP